MGRRARDEGLIAAVIVVELDEHGVHEGFASEELVVGRVRVRALRRGGKEPFSARRCRVGVHEGAKLIGERGDVGDGGFEIEVEAVDESGAKGSKGARAGLFWPECGPDEVCFRDGSR